MLVSLLPSAAWARSSYTVTVLSVSDGDTIEVQERKKTYSVRLACIDAPERLQIGGLPASSRLRELVPEGSQIQLEVVNDKSEQVIAEVMQDGRSVNLQLVREGMAVIYPQLFQACYSHREDYYQAQAEAKQQQKGLWAQSNPLMPWEWRRRNRSPIKPDSGSVAFNLPWQKSNL